MSLVKSFEQTPIACEFSQHPAFKLMVVRDVPDRRLVPFDTIAWRCGEEEFWNAETILNALEDARVGTKPVASKSKRSFQSGGAPSILGA